MRGEARRATGWIARWLVRSWACGLAGRRAWLDSELAETRAVGLVGVPASGAGSRTDWRVDR
eukprot:8596393-Alexandrium_andersonii.AAC.1